MAGAVKLQLFAPCSTHFPGVGHNDLVPLAGEAYAEAVGSWVRGLERV